MDTRQPNDDAQSKPGSSRWRPFIEARELARSLGLKNQKEWQTWCSSGKRPADIPPAPHRAYPGEWLGLQDWLGTGKPLRQAAGRCLEVRPFAEARVFAHGLGLMSHAQWRDWSKTDARPEDIPRDPYHAYRESGWISWSDWLGTGLRKRTFGNSAFRPFAEARDFAREKRFRSSEEWKAFARSSECPADIPVDPDRRYQDQGWCGWADWLGHFVAWKLNEIRAFLGSLSSVIDDLQPVELYSILSRNGLLGVDRRNSNMKVIEEIERLCSAKDKESVFERLARTVGAPVPEEETPTKSDELRDLTVDDLQQPSELPQLRSLDSLKALDHLVHTGLTRDEEVLEFLIDNRVSMLWQQFLDENPNYSLERLRAESGGEYFGRIRQRFDEQFEGAKNLAIPPGYSFQKGGQRVEPNLMQRLAAYRLLKDRRIGNWSGVGAGKTISAVLSSRVLDAHLTVIVAANATLDGWAKVVRQVFPDSVVIVKERGDLKVDPAAYTYLIINFEQFQQKWSREFVERLTDQHKIDFIVVDEIQFVKQRRESPKSSRPDTRREVVRRLIDQAGTRNPDLRVLGMSATPVMSSLYEAKSLLELITGASHDDLATAPTISNAVRVHHRLIRHGIRYRPQYKLSLKTEYPILDGHSCLPLLRQVKPGAVAELENAVLDAKRDGILSFLRPGTLIYTHFLEGMVEPLAETVQKAGFKVGRYTGKDKTGLPLFLDKKVDILIGTSPVGIGVDGLQYVCNRLVFISLPWTRAEYDQIVGRLHRQGSIFDKVEIVIPQVVLRDEAGGFWSWDDQRLQVIRYKKTLADAALDGVIPQGRQLPSQEEMQRHSVSALQEWIAKVAAAGSSAS